MSDLPDHGIWAGIGAMVGGAIVGGKKVLSLFRGKSSDPPPPPQLPAEPSVMSVRLGALAVRVDGLEREMTMTRSEQAQKLADIYESLDELRVANAKTAAVLPIVQEQVRDLADHLLKRRKE